MENKKEEKNVTSQVIIKKKKTPKLEPKFFDSLKLVFTPRAFSKAMHWRYNKKGWEISGQGISYSANRLYIDDFELVKQESSSVTTDFDDQGWLEFMHEMKTGRNLQPFQFLSVLVHTHPGFSTNPSGTDEKNWKDRIEKDQRDFYVMCIVSDGPESAHARLFMKEPVSLVTEIPVKIDWSGPKMTETKEELDAIFDKLVSAKTSNHFYVLGTTPKGYQKKTQVSTTQGNFGLTDMSRNSWFKNEQEFQKAQINKEENFDIEIELEEELAKEFEEVKRKQKEFEAKAKKLTNPANIDTTAVYKPCKKCKTVFPIKKLDKGVCKKCRLSYNKEDFQFGNVVELNEWEDETDKNNVTFQPDDHDKKLFGKQVEVIETNEPIGNNWFGFYVDSTIRSWPKKAAKIVEKIKKN